MKEVKSHLLLDEQLRVDRFCAVVPVGDALSVRVVVQHAAAVVPGQQFGPRLRRRKVSGRRRQRRTAIRPKRFDE